MTKNTLPPKCARVANEEHMELVCEKYKETVDPDDPVCRHPDDYCQTRSGCIIHFMEKEKQRTQQKKMASSKQAGKASTGTVPC